MAAKVIRHPRTGKPIQPKRGAQQRGRQNHRGYPDGQGPGGYQRGSFAGANGDETVVVCESGDSKEKKKFPWGTVFITAMVTGFGVIVANKVYEKMSGGAKQSNPEVDPRRGLLDARDYLLLAAPGAENAIGRMPQQPQVINAGASQREIELMEQSAQLRERMAEMEGFLAGQQAASQQQDSLSALLAAAEDDD